MGQRRFRGRRFGSVAVVTVLLQNCSPWTTKKSTLVVHASRLFSNGANDAFVLDEDAVRVSAEAAILSDAIYDYDDDDDDDDDDDRVVFDDRADRAVVAGRRRDAPGVCFGVFRGTDAFDLDDWSQNADLRRSSLCGRRRRPSIDVEEKKNDDEDDEDDEEKICCRVLRGFHRAYADAAYRDAFEERLRACVSQCLVEHNDDDDDVECRVVLTGHSQGGAAAVVAAAYLRDLEPTVIAFGPPSALAERPCPLLDDATVVSYVASVTNDDDERAKDRQRDLDPAPFLYAGVAEPVGRVVLLTGGGADAGALALRVDDDDDDERTWRGLDPPLSLAAHWSAHYVRSLMALRSTITNRVRTKGFSNGVACGDADALCRSGSCGEGGVCRHPNLNCDGPCDGPTDCVSGHCVAGACAEAPSSPSGAGTVETNCPCGSRADCVSDRCEHETWYSVRRVCLSKLPRGASCNEHNDCLSDLCTWWYRCD